MESKAGFFSWLNYPQLTLPQLSHLPSIILGRDDIGSLSGRGRWRTLEHSMDGPAQKQWKTQWNIVKVQKRLPFKNIHRWFTHSEPGFWQPPKWCVYIILFFQVMKSHQLRGVYPRHLQPLEWKEFLHKLLVGGVRLCSRRMLEKS